jgi:glycosyltransferase involved in cell wall biosynthesis
MVTTYNWETALDRVLASIATQHVLPDEVLVADDGSGSATRAVVDRWTERLSVPVQHVWHEDLGFRLAAIRNRALAAARGEYILMIDGDLVLHPEFVRSHAAFARRGTYVQGSRVMVGESTTRRMLAGEQVPLHFFARGIRNRFNAIHLPVLSRFHRGAQGPLQRTRGANLAYWLSDARLVNGFNEDMEGWGREDSEFVARLQNAGVARRNFKFGGVTYHLHHKTRSQDAVSVNHRIFEQVVRERRTWCPNGLDKYPTPVARDATPTRAR